ncbi:4-(cytidine 5'-diphospho)-2-C-methyl-D-erythritol kinase [Corynebacterium pacaense]|uniref:4-(cytidine 5'-diphospho)-2-C-methyl-D-erythritol kinase n=1 Tax=Corynebacterium pacaense TaxID=1816684 RepID=UPI0009BAD183|nr:4-(cytidine 5'-diphospho)-2-C-methyl-D-erythritol kinase [Corynebacterium pacaense]
MIVTARAWSKINLHLGVGAARGDGFHELLTVFQTLDLHDEVTLRIDPSRPAGAGSVVRSLTSSGASGVPADESNLAWRAVDALVGHWRAAHPGEPLATVDIHIRKGIPVAGGMAGGSADAAAALRAVDSWLGPFGQDTLLVIASGLGSDVPFTLLGGTMLGTGRGEKLVDVLCRGRYHWAIAVSPRGLSTPTVFNKLDQMQRVPSLDIDELVRALLSGDPHELAPHLRNDLQAAALSLRPDLRGTLAAGTRAGALAGIVSGSGPTVAFLCADARHAEDVAEEIRDAVSIVVHTASGPVPPPHRGAHIISTESE